MYLNTWKPIVPKELVITWILIVSRNSSKKNELRWSLKKRYQDKMRWDDWPKKDHSHLKRIPPGIKNYILFRLNDAFHRCTCYVVYRFVIFAWTNFFPKTQNSEIMSILTEFINSIFKIISRCEYWSLFQSKRRI